VSIFVNRTLNLKQIQAIGFDMDYTLVRYNSENFEKMTYEEIKVKLLAKGYPAIIKKLQFQYDRTIRGLVIDKPHGNVIKLSTFSKVKQCFHGTKEMDFKSQQKIYQGLSIDLKDNGRFSIVDTIFSIAYATMYMQIIDLKDANPELNFPDYLKLENDLLDAMDISHRDGTLKGEVRKNIKKYIIQDKACVEALEEFKKFGKKLWVITNSDYEYTKLLLNYTINPFLKNHKHWSELFDLTITSATKPRFFTDRQPFLKIDPKSGLMSNHFSKIETGIFQGGSANTLLNDQNLQGEQILYIGDHIYGDVLTLKKHCNWRTALVVEELEHEINVQNKAKALSHEMNELMNQKIALESKIDDFIDLGIRQNKKQPKDKVNDLFKQMELLDKKLSVLITKYRKNFNPYWGEVMRAGLEPSRIAGQIEKYACIYMSKIADFNDYSPRHYYRPRKRVLPHDQV
jgi:HAD superfamily 5'-nucleotidase-like hydrolase